MKKQELQQIYDLCSDEWARYTLAGGVQVDTKLLSIITKLEEEKIKQKKEKRRNIEKINKLLLFMKNLYLFDCFIGLQIV